jgi:hypothetical protein
MDREQVVEVLNGALAGTTKRVKVAFTLATATRFVRLMKMAEECQVQLIPRDGIWENDRLICFVDIIDVLFDKRRFLNELADALEDIQVVGPGK